MFGILKNVECWISEAERKVIESIQISPSGQGKNELVCPYKSSRSVHSEIRIPGLNTGKIIIVYCFLLYIMLLINMYVVCYALHKSTW